jgi:foldase protein PrsA
MAKSKKSATRSKSNSKKKNTSPKTKKFSFKVKKENMGKSLKTLGFWIVLFFVSLVIVDYVVQYLNYHASVAVVNGERISRRDFYEDLEQSYGTTVVGQMIDEALVYQEADKQEVEIAQEDIDTEIENLEEEYGGEDVLNEELKAIGITREQLRYQIETTLLVKELLKDETSFTEDEAKEYFEEYKDSLYPNDEDVTFEEVQDEVEEYLRDQKLSEAVSPWLSNLKSDASIQNNIDDPKDYGFLGITRDFLSGMFE